MWRHGLRSIEVIERRRKMTAEMRRIRSEMRELERFPLGLNRDSQGVRKGGVLAVDSVSGMRFAAASVSSCDGCPPKWRQILRSCRACCNMIGIRSNARHTIASPRAGVAVIVLRAGMVALHLRHGRYRQT